VGTLSRKYKGKYIVVWPSNIDSTKSRSEGRKISLKDSVKSPKPKELIEAAKELGILISVEEKSYPSNWWQEKTRIVVLKSKRKIELLKELASKIKEIRMRKRQ